ncbi:MAG: hypothetical protein FJY85_18955, partial [Deltaproteobacteria bacterium]|nr:hypothetical protein [Deltaproteobacteria bacterium]
MKSGRLAIIRGGNGIGDLLISSMLPRILKENGDFHIDHFCWPENKAVLLNNPYIDKISMYPNKDDPEYKRIIGENSNNYDAILITAWTLEKMFLWRTSGEWGIPSLENRRKANEGVNYTEAVLKTMGIEINGQVL